MTAAETMIKVMTVNGIHHQQRLQLLPRYSTYLSVGNMPNNDSINKKNFCNLMKNVIIQNIKYVIYLSGMEKCSSSVPLVKLDALGGG